MLYCLTRTVLPVIMSIFSFQMVHSKLQQNVLQCYKDLLKHSKNLPAAQGRIRAEFQENKTIRRMDIQIIEYKLRYANRRLDKLKSDFITDTVSFSFKNEDAPKSENVVTPKRQYRNNVEVLNRKK
jgi:hypothetical protein